MKRAKPVLTKPISNSIVAEVKTYKLSPEELEKYRNIKPPLSTNDIRTTANQGKKRSFRNGRSY